MLKAECQQKLDEKDKFIADAMQKIKQLEYQIQDLKGRIRICVRVRPAKNRCQITYPDQLSYKKQLAYVTMGLKSVDGTDCNTEVGLDFDRIFSEGDGQDAVFAEVEPLIEQIFQGYKTCIFAYGQSGSGKTYTQYGSIMPRALEYIFRQRASATGQISVSASFYGIYNDEAYDLLADQTAANLASSAVEPTGFSAPKLKVSIVG